MGYEGLDCIVLSDPVGWIFQFDNKFSVSRTVSAGLLMSELVLVTPLRFDELAQTT